MIRLLRDKQWTHWEDTAFQAMCHTFPSTLVDLGTGDGKFPYLMAREDETRLCLGVDAQTAGFSHFAWKGARKPSRGGLVAQNLFYLQADLPDLPPGLKGMADVITLRLPWAGLLREAILPSEGFLKMLKGLSKPNAWVIFQLNVSIFKDPSYVERLNLPAFDAAYREAVLEPAYLQAGFSFWDDPNPPEALTPFLKPTSWQQRLHHGDQQRKTQTLMLKHRD